MTNFPMINFIITCIIWIVGIIIGIYAEKRIKKYINERKRKYGDKKGTIFFNKKAFEYHLKTFDKGLHWYAICPELEKNNPKEIIIFGKVKDIYPGLMGYIQSWENINQKIELDIDLIDEDCELVTCARKFLKEKFEKGEIDAKMVQEKT